MVTRLLKTSFLLGLLLTLAACSGGEAFEEPIIEVPIIEINANTTITSYRLDSQRLFTENSGSTDVIVRAFASNGAVVRNADITVSIDGIGTSGTNGNRFVLRTDENGDIAIPISTTVAGITTITVDSDVVVRRFNIYFGVTINSNLLNNGQPANGSSPSTILVRVLDHIGVPITNLDGTLSFSAGSFAVAVTLPAGTDENGVYAVDITDRRAETLTVTPILGGLRTQDLSLTFTTTDSVVKPVFVTLSLSTNNVLADGQSSADIVVITRDISGAPIAGIDVRLSTNSGTAFLGTGTGITGNNGVFTTNISNAVIESVQLRATAGTVTSNPIDINFIKEINTEIPVTSVSIEVTGNNALANGTDTVQLVIYAKDAQNNPVPAANISFKVSGGSANFSTDSGITDNLGRFILDITDIIVETFTVTPIVGGVSGALTSITFVSSGDGENNKPTSIDLNITSNNQRADGVAAVNLIVIVRDQNNTPLSNSLIVLASTSSTAQFQTVTGQTNAGGSFTTTVTNNVAGRFTVTASSGAINDTETINFITTPSAANVNVTLTNNNQFANGSDATTLTAIIRDSSGRPVPDTSVTLIFSANAAGRPSSAIPAEATGLTDAGGAFVTTITDTIAESFTIQVAVEGTQIQGRSPLIVFNAASATTPPASVTTSTNIDTQVADGQAEISLTVVARDATGTPIIDIPVSLASSSGSALIKPASGSTGNDGAFIAIITNTKAETVTITPTGGGVQGNTVTVNFTQNLTVTPATVTLNFANNNAIANGQEEIILTVVVRSDIGTPVIDVPVSLSSDSLTALFSGTIGANGITNAGGTFTTTLTNTVSESVTLIPTAGGITGQATQVNFQGALSETATSMQLLTSSPQLLSEGVASGVIITALLKTGDNNPFAGTTIRFSADSGVIQPIVIAESEAEAGITDITGRAQARLTTEANPINRDIVVTASSGALTETVLVKVSGTEISITGADTAILGSETEYTIFLKDSGGNGVTGQTVNITSALNNPIINNNEGAFITDDSGRVTVRLNAQNAGTDTLNATGANAIPANKQVVISDDNFVVTRDDELPLTTDVLLNNSVNFTVTWDKNGSVADIIGKTINISASRGDLSTNKTSMSLAGTASFSIEADNAGPTTITVNTEIADGPSSAFTFDFVADEAATINLQANPSTISVNAIGSTAEQSTIIAVVRDPRNNLVKGKRVEFKLDDITRGSISPSSAVTDQFGRANTVYTAGASPSASDGVHFTATVVENLSVNAEVSLTVARRSVFVSLGTGNSILEPNATTYQLPYTVLVNDVNGAPITGAEVILSAIPTRYFKGTRFLLGVDATLWTTQSTVDGGCINEDTNANGLLEAGEDLNNNGRLDPGNPVTFEPNSVITDANGFANFDMLYAQENTDWLEINLIARTLVSGSEDRDDATFIIRGSASDFVPTTTPPGTPSPYGIGGNSVITNADGSTSIVLNEVLLNRDVNGDGRLDTSLPATCLYDK